MSAQRDRLACGSSIRFFGRRFLFVGPLCLAIACGRVVQTGMPAQDFTMAQVLLEIFVEAGRVTLAVLAIGAGGFNAGIRAIKRFFRMPERERNARFTALKERAARDGKSLAMDLAIYVVAALGLNIAIGAIAELPVVVDAVAAAGVNPADAITLWLKNLTVIPLTIVFQVHFGARLWLSPAERGTWLGPQDRTRNSQ